MYDHPRHPLRARADLRRPGLDPGGVHAGLAAQPPGLGDVRLRLLLHRDLRLGGGVRLRRPSEQRPLGRRRLYLPRRRGLLLPQCFSGSGQRHPEHNRPELPELQAGRLSSGVLVRGDASLLLPHPPVCHSMEVFLEASERRDTLGARGARRRWRWRLAAQATSGSPRRLSVAELEAFQGFS